MQIDKAKGKFPVDPGQAMLFDTMRYMWDRNQEIGCPIPTNYATYGEEQLNNGEAKQLLVWRDMAGIAIDYLGSRYGMADVAQVVHDHGVMHLETMRLEPSFINKSIAEWDQWVELMRSVNEYISTWDGSRYPPPTDLPKGKYGLKKRRTIAA